MDASDLIKRFHDFLESNYSKDLMENIRLGKKFLIVDFNEMAKFDPDLANELLEFPEETIKGAELAVQEIDQNQKTFRIRFKSLPKSQKMMIRNIRSSHIGKLFYYDGVVRQKSDVRPQMTSSKFECPSCGNIISILQLEKKFREPTTCGCGRKGKFKLISKELIDAQGIVMEEAAEDLDGGEQPKRMNILLKEDLVSPLSEKHTNPGSKIIVCGIIKEVPVPSKDGGQLTRFDLIIEANYIEASQEDYYEIEITKEDEEKIKEIANSQNYKKRIIQSIAPSIYGFEKVKEAIALQLVGGVKKERTDGMTTRGDMHVLLIGDPGAGKSQLLKRVSKIAPKARFVSGKGVSGAGLTASVVKDEFLNGWSLEAGALPLANKGFCMIDEMDKMSDEDRSAMHEALEGQTITISKANIQATLRTETTVLAAANPKFGRFDPYELLAKQIDMPPALINRFDLIFAIKDVPSRERDSFMSEHILKLHQTPDVEEPAVDTKLLKKYISYARQHCRPQLTTEALKEIQRFYVDMRNSGGEQSGPKAIPVSARQLEGLVRMSEAEAKLRLSKEVTKDDAINAVELLRFSLEEIGLDPETGKIDIDRIASGITQSQRNKIHGIKEIIQELEVSLNTKNIPIEEIKKVAKERGISDIQTDEYIEKLRKTGDLFEPKRGIISRI